MSEPAGLQLEKLRIDRTAAAKPRSTGLAAWLLLLALLAAGGWFARHWVGSALARVRQPQVQVGWAARPDPLRPGTAEGVAANGYIVARRRAALSADAPGRIVELLVEEGSRVERGALVARLYAAEHQAALASAEANLRAAESAVARAPPSKSRWLARA